MFQATQKIKLFSILEDMRVAMPGLADQLGNDYTDETKLIRKAAPSDAIEILPAQMVIVGRISSIAVDTYDEVVLPEGGDYTSYRKNNVVLWGHNYSSELPHAENEWIKAYPTTSPTEVRAATKYYEDSERGMEIFKHRSLKRPLGYSIGFIPTKTVYRGDDEWVDAFTDWRDRYAAYKSIKAKDIKEPYCIYQEWMLLEYSDVVVPANPDAVSLFVAKGFIEPEEVDEYTIQPADEDVDLTTMDRIKNVDEWEEKELKDYVLSVLKETEKFRQSFTPKNPVEVIIPKDENERVALILKQMDTDDEIKNYVLKVIEEANSDRDDSDLPADDANIPEAVKSAVSQAFEKVAMPDIEINVPEALKEFNISTLLASVQGRLE